MQSGGGPKRLNLRLKKFDMSRIKHDKVVVLIGKRETGKSFLVKDLLQVLIGDAAIIHRRLVLMLYHQLRSCFPLVLHHNYSRLINLVSKSRAINQIWRAISFVVILLLVPLSASLRSLITFISISTLFMIRSPHKKVIWQ
jgi:hypothetical protein